MSQCYINLEHLVFNLRTPVGNGSKPFPIELSSLSVGWLLTLHQQIFFSYFVIILQFFNTSLITDMSIINDITTVAQL